MGRASRLSERVYMYVQPDREMERKGGRQYSSVEKRMSDLFILEGGEEGQRRHCKSGENDFPLFAFIPKGTWPNGQPAIPQ